MNHDLGIPINININGSKRMNTVATPIVHHTTDDSFALLTNNYVVIIYLYALRNEKTGFS